MPRPRKPVSLPQLSAAQAQFILERLVNDRRISTSEISRYMSDLQREISALEQRLQSLRSTAGGGGAHPVRRGPGRPPGSGASAPAAPGRRRRRRRSAALSPEQRASRQLQGQYLGLIRQIPATRRAQYAKIAKEKGREAAIRVPHSKALDPPKLGMAGAPITRSHFAYSL